MSRLAAQLKALRLVGSILLCVLLPLFARADISLVYDPTLAEAPFISSLKSQISNIHSPVNYAIKITLGPHALKTALSSMSPQEILIAALITREEFETLKPQSPVSNRLTAIYYEPSPLALALLASEILGKEAKLALPYRENAHLASYISSINLPKQVNLVPTSHPRKWLRYIREYDGVIASIDSGLFSHANMTSITRSLYRQRKAFIGFSFEMTRKPQTLASLYVDEEHLISDIQKTINVFESRNELPQPQYAKQYRVAINQTLARTLGYPFLDERSLETKITTALHTQGGTQ